MAYEVRTPVFEGPFDLLLHLITREQVDLYEVSLSRIVDGYLAHLAGLHHVELDAATEFLLIAATLVELKTRRLLPGREEVDLDEELALWEERDLLLARLLECKTFKDAARALHDLAVEAARSLPRVAGMEERFSSLVPDLLAGVTPAGLRAAFVSALTPRPQPRIDLDHVAPIGVSVGDAVAELMGELPRLGVVSFHRLTEQVAERLAVVVRFLAVLELYKDGLVDLDQATNFGELRITWLGHEATEPLRAAGGADAETAAQP
ncbi:MAG: segregation/condensation protein A [Actinomycetota bacterium]|nr:segregation/condensation protein A [Actinomycetota bacterium]